LADEVGPYTRSGTLGRGFHFGPRSGTTNCVHRIYPGRDVSVVKRTFHAAIALAVSASLALTPVAFATAAPAGTGGAVEVEVLAFSSNDAVDEAAALTDAFKHALISAPGVADHGKSHALEAVALTAGCDDPSAASCAPKIANEIKWDKFIYGTVKKTPPNKITATLHYYNAGQIKTVAKTYDAGPVAKDGMSPELKKIATDALFSLLGGAPKGKLEVTVSGPAASEDGELFENGQSIGTITAGKGTIDLPSGTHTVELRIKGFAPQSGEVEVTPAGATLQLAPVRLPPSKPIDFQLYGGIAAIAVGAVFVGLGVSNSLGVLKAQDDSTFDSYRRQYKGNVDVCDKAHAGEGTSKTDAAYVANLCDETANKQRAQYIFYGIGGALVIGGTILILTDKTGSGDKAADKTALLKVQLKPVLTPTYQAFSLTGTF
jgi:hypothetical protein